MSSETPTTMVFHGFLIAIAIYIILVLVGQSKEVAYTRAVTIGLLAAAYMIIFGHRYPTNINKELI